MDKLRFSIVGYGRMGKLVGEVLRKNDEPVSSTIDPAMDGMGWRDDSLKDTDSAICFTTPDAGYDTTMRILQKGVDAVVATTKIYLNGDGTLNQEMIDEFANLARKTKSRMIYASNFSIGMNAYWEILKPLAEMMSNLGYDVAVEEKHHQRKADVSGSAKTIGNILLAAYPSKVRMNFGDCERKREDDDITVASSRVGHVPGTHTVYFDSAVDSLELTHTVRDPGIFAIGAVESAYWLRNQEPGVYNIKNRLLAGPHQ